jgi:hypothetical protein
MASRERRRERRPGPSEKTLKEPEKLSPIPTAAPSEEPQVDEVLPPEEESERERELRKRAGSPL